MRSILADAIRTIEGGKRVKTFKTACAVRAPFRSFLMPSASCTRGFSTHHESHLRGKQAMWLVSFGVNIAVMIQDTWDFILLKD